MAIKEVNRIIGSRVKEARNRAGLTGDELGSMIGKSKQWVYSKESGNIGVSLVDAIKISDACGVRLSYFEDLTLK